MPQYPNTLSIKGWKGINNRDEDFKTDLKYLKEATNVDIDNNGGIQRRDGLTQISTGKYSNPYIFNNKIICLYNNDLVVLNPDMSIYKTILNSVVDSKIYYQELDGELYLLSKYLRLVVDKNFNTRSFGINPPNPSVTLQTTSGVLPEGKYIVTITYVTDSGLESGTILYSEITLTTPSNIKVTNIPAPTNPEVTKFNVYCSDPNGSELYYYNTYPITTPDLEISSRPYSYTLDKFGIQPPPYGENLAYYRGRFYLSVDNIIYYSEPNYYEGWRLDSNYIYFDSNINDILPVDNGIWICTEQEIIYLSGESPDNFNLHVRDTVKPYKNSGVKIKAKDLVIDNTPLGDKWLISSDRGVYILFNDGVSFSVTDVYKFPENKTCNTSLVYKDGLSKYLINTNKKPNNFKFNESFEATVIKAQ